MRPRTVAVSLALLAGLAALVAVGLGTGPAGGSLSEAWVSDTPRENDLNHHGVGVGPDEEVVVAPVAEVPDAEAPITDDSCQLVRLDPADGDVVWRDGVPAADCFTHALTKPAVADVDGDGRLEVVAATTEDAVVVLDAATGDERARFPTPSYGYGRPTVADVTVAPGREIFVSDLHGTVVAGRPDGTVLWETALGERFEGSTRVYDSPVVADVDADGTDEVVVGTTSGPAVLEPDGSVAWVRESGASHVAVVGADGKDSATVLAAETGVIRAYDGSTGDEQWKRAFDAIAAFDATADGDGTPELYVGLADGDVAAVDAGSGDVRWTTTVTTADDGTVTAPALADVDGDGDPEVVAATRDGTVAVLDRESGAELAAYQRAVPVWTAPTPADLDGDGAADLLVRYGDGRVVALAYES